jgi:hypothetical protein
MKRWKLETKSRPFFQHKITVSTKNLAAPNRPDAYTFQLKVTDNAGGTGYGQTNVTVYSITHVFVADSKKRPVGNIGNTTFPPM